MSKKIEQNEKRILQEKYREEFKEKFRERIEKGEVMDFT
jgi:uncharacterized protein YnzC (UPF0291/DUF896 family)